MSDFQREVGAWADVMFPSSTIHTVALHLAREVKELAQALGELPPPGYRTWGDVLTVMEEAADCYLLLLHLAHKLGESLDGAAAVKMMVNRRRTWDKPDAEGVVEHMR